MIPRWFEDDHNQDDDDDDDDADDAADADAADDDDDEDDDEDEDDEDDDDDDDDDDDVDDVDVKGHPLHRRVGPSHAPASHNPVHRRGGYPVITTLRGRRGSWQHARVSSLCVAGVALDTATFALRGRCGA